MIRPKIMTAVSAAWRATRYFLWHGRIQISDTDREARLRICLACPHYKPVSKHELMGQCKICTCIVQAKTRLITEKCPKDLWIL